MARLRVRLELNRHSAGVPLDKLASVVEETRKFFHLLAEDVRIETGRGEWVASDFDTGSLNFTAEYSGPVTAEQVRAFGAAFAGATSLRRATIAQFTRIADFLGEDELVGFGLYQSEEETEPSEWRCLSKRDAQRFGQEIQLLAQAAGDSQPETALPAVMNGSVAGRRLFKDRREREALAADPSKLIREVESNLARRIGLLEGEVAQTRKLREIGPASPAPDERFNQLLSAMETFWVHTSRQMPLLPAPAPAPVQAPPSPAARKPKRWWMLGVAVAAAAVTLSFAFPELQRQWSRYTVVETMPLIHPKAPAAPSLVVPPKPPMRFEGPRINLQIPADVRALVPSEARVEVIVAIDERGKVTQAEVASTEGEGARLLTKEALAAARQSRFQPARQGWRPVPSQMVLTYLFKPPATAF
jgi:TonB family protein